MRRSLLKDNAPLLLGLVRLCDPLLAILAGWLAYRWYLGTWILPERYQIALIGVAVFCFALFPLLRLYAPQRGVTLFEEAGRLVNAWLLIAAAWFGYLFLSKSGADFSRAWSLYWIAFGAATHVAFRAAIRLVLRELRRRGFNQRHIVVVGAGRLGQDIARRLAAMPWSGLSVRAFYDDDPALAGATVEGVAVRGNVDAVAEGLTAGSIDQVWIALPLRADARIRSLLRQLRRHSVEVRLVPDIFNFALLNHSMTEVAGLPVINLAESPLSGVNRAIKGAEDIVLSALLLAAAAPAMLLIAAGIKLSSPGPVFYAQERVTWNGRRFMMKKFRTMAVDAEAGSGPVWADRRQGRATPFGAFLRRMSLDELPQLVNVLRGEMSLVGPRPERPEFVERFKDEIPGYMQKHMVKAGITGWAQVNDLRGNTDLAERIRFDLYYIENWSLMFDLRILALTVSHVIRTRNAY
jgi:putative colanic acid biosysnthesis UDP-glucose lipid carrier transferase